MTTAQTGPGAMAGAVDAGKFTAASDRSDLPSRVRELWLRLVSLPDRGRDASRDHLPPEFFRFPCF
jgi:hypothetical protein